MMADFDLSSFFDSDAFNSLDDTAKGILREFSEKAAGKSQADAIAVFMEYRGKLKVGADKQKALMEALKGALAPENRKKLDLMEMLYYRSGK